MLHLQLNSGTDLVLFNALRPTSPSRAGSTASSSPRAPRASTRRCRPTAPAWRRRREVTGLPPEDIVKAARWIAEPKEGGKRRRTMFGYEKGLIWGNDNYRTNAAS